jgi:predicted transcriptional regulator
LKTIFNANKQTKNYFKELLNQLNSIDQNLSEEEKELVKRKVLTIWEFLEKQHNIKVEIKDVIQLTILED